MTADDLFRASNADREAMLVRLREAMSEGRITLEEFDERTQHTLQARTRGELATIGADLPGAAARPAVEDTVVLSGIVGSVKRKGDWQVPRHLVLRARLGSVELDFTSARIEHRVVTVELDILGGSVEVRLPEDAAASLSGVEVILGSTEDHSRSSGSGVRFEFTGRIVAGSAEVRGPKRSFLRPR
ncbi:MAG: DUF1707 domain-containing protein [Pseudonocardia sp.]|nr:DUF1707 domain-containing protein [Pseudonocardia sp.]